MFILFNALGFQLVWWLTALFQEQFSWLVAGLVLLHFYFLPREERSLEAKMVLPCVGLGIYTDSLLSFFGVLVFAGENTQSLLIPYWMILLWLGFACTLRHSLNWVFKKWWVTLIVGGAGGTLSYISASRFSALTLQSDVTTYAVLFIIWASLFLLFKLYFRLFLKKGP